MVWDSYLGPGVRLDLGKLELCVVRIHLLDLFPGGGAQDLDDLHQLVHSAVPGEDGLTQHELSKDAARGPDVNVGGVVRGPKYQLWCPAEKDDISIKHPSR